MTKPAVWLFLGLLLGLGAGGVIGRMTAPDPDPPAITCRPTLPALATQGSADPVLLLWGNSLLFDNDWTNAGHVPVNCARQGQTAATARPLTVGLPPVEPDTVLLAFGSVEAFLAGRDGRAVDAGTFATEIDAIVAEIAARWPEARIIAAGVPGFMQGAAALNQALAASRAEFLDLDALLAGLGADATYDGVHLTQAAYAAWEAAIRP